MNPRQSGHKLCKVVKAESEILTWFVDHQVYHQWVLTHECGKIEKRTDHLLDRDGKFKPAPKRVRCYRKGE